LIFVHNGVTSPIVLDEVQRASDLFLAIKASVDRDRRPGRSGAGTAIGHHRWHRSEKRRHRHRIRLQGTVPALGQHLVDPKSLSVRTHRKLLSQ